MNSNPSTHFPQELFENAFALHQTGQLDSAETLYQQIIARDPDHAHAIQSLGLIALARHQRQDAVRLLTKAVGLKPKEAVFHHGLAQALRADGRLLEAVETLKKAVSLNPGFVGGWQALAEVYYALNRPVDAMRAIEKMVELKKASEQHNKDGVELVNKGRLPEALAAFRAGVVCNPMAAGLYYNMGCVLLELGQVKDATLAFGQAATLAPKAADPYIGLSNALYANGDFENSKKARDQAFALNPGISRNLFKLDANPASGQPVSYEVRSVTASVSFQSAIPATSARSILERAVEQHRAGQMDAAEMDYRKVLETEPDNVDALHLLGVLVHQRGDHLTALSFVDRALASNDRVANIHSNRAAVLAALDRLDDSESSCQRALRLDPKHVSAHTTLASVKARRAQSTAKLESAAPSNTPRPHEVAGNSPPVDLESSDIPSSYRRAVALLQVEHLDQAESVCQQILGVQPEHSDALHLLGIIATKKNKPQSGSEWISRAVALNPNNAAAHSNLGSLLTDLGRLPEALASCDRAIALRPNFPAALYNRGNVLRRLGRYEAAIADYDLVLHWKSDHLDAMLNRSLALRKLSRFAEALESCDHIVTLYPKSVEAHCYRGDVLFDLHRYQEALVSYEDALQLQADDINVSRGYGAALLEMGRTAEAEEWLRRATAIAPQSATLHNALGIALLRRSAYPEARTVLERAADLDGTSAEVLTTLGTLETACGQPEKAELLLRRAIEIDPTRSSTQVILGMTLLSQGRYSEGWLLYELRSDPVSLVLPSLSFPRWRGEPLVGRSILIWPEQGYGDLIQFCRFAPALKGQGARKVTLVCEAPLAPLLETLDGVDSILTGDVESTCDAHDYWALPLSLPLHLGTSLETIPAKLPYLRASPDRLKRWSARVPSDGLKVGLVWKGRKQHQHDADRSLPGLPTLEPLWRARSDKTVFFSLQKGAGTEEALTPPASQPLIDFGSHIEDFADTAAIVELLDLVICVDTAIAHLAGALNKPCWILLSCRRTDWRWLHGRTDSPWYPNSLRLFRQRAENNWESVVEEVSNALSRFTSGASET